MNKVAKEQLGLFKPQKIADVAFDLKSRECLHNILAKNEQARFIELGKTMMAAGKTQIFDAWSLSNQDLVQAAAHAYGERVVSWISKFWKFKKNLKSIKKVTFRVKVRSTLSFTVDQA